MNNCPVCEDKKRKIFKGKASLIYNSVFDLVECGCCGLIYFNPLPSLNQLNEFYSAQYFNFEKEREEGKGMVFAKRLKKIKDTGKFLDVGCATGFFLNGIKNNSKWEVYGTEFSEEAVKFAREKLMLNVFKGDLFDAGFPDGYFDYIHINNVLEHVLRPVSLLQECRRIIKQNGTIMLSVPNGFNDSLELIDFYNIKKIPALSGNGHIFFFPAKTLFFIFDKTGFFIKVKKTYSVKKGLRNIGLLLKKKDWEEGLLPKEMAGITKQKGIIINENTRKHSDFYYTYRYFWGDLKMIPGLHKYGLDFLFTLKPKPFLDKMCHS